MQLASGGRARKSRHLDATSRGLTTVQFQSVGGNANRANIDRASHLATPVFDRQLARAWSEARGHLDDRLVPRFRDHGVGLISRSRYAPPVIVANCVTS